MAAETFEPGKFLSKVNGNDYLEVKWRLVWLRTEHPDSTIETELVSMVDDRAVFKATVAIPGGGSSTGWGSETAQGFANHIEKAETKAIGRALAALGYGTQFCPDFDGGVSENRLVDAPVSINGNGSAPTGLFSRDGASGDQLATVRQRNLIAMLGKEQKLDGKLMNELAMELVGSSIHDLTRRDASQVIEHLKERSQQAPGARIA